MLIFDLNIKILMLTGVVIYVFIPSTRMLPHLPQFPEFQTVDFEHKSAFERAAFEHRVYADFNFNNFYAWNVEGAHALSLHNNNLALRFSDYVTGERFYSVAGTNNIDTSIQELLKLSEAEGLKPALALIPETTVAAIQSKNNFIVQEDESSHDYILSIPAIAKMSGKKFNSKRRAMKKIEECGEYTTIDVSSDQMAADQTLKIMQDWERDKLNNEKTVEMKYELNSVELMLRHLFEQDNVLLTFVQHQGEPVGFSIDEMLPGNYVLSHYFKTLPSIKGLTEFLNMRVANELSTRGYKFWNWQQDLGLSTLRNMKLSYRPVAKLKKYTVEKVS